MIEQPVQIGEEEVRRVLTPDVLIGLMADALKKCAAGEAIQPLRTIHRLPEGKIFGFMPAYLGDDDYFGAKLVTAVPANQGTEYPSHLGSVLLFDSPHGSLRAMADATSITELRTGAVSAVATKFLAREDAKVLALIGCGAQARGHIRTLTRVRKIEEIRLFAPHPESAQKLKAETEAQYGIPSLVCASVEEAVRPADIVCTLTPCSEPYMKLEWIRPGTHINAVGAFSPTTREVTGEVVAASRLYADHVDAMLQECGEYLIPEREGLIDRKHIVGSIGDILLGKVPGRRNSSEITLFDALGLAIEDVACARYLYLQHIK